jgi:hypothetical protein
MTEAPSVTHVTSAQEPGIPPGSSVFNNSNSNPNNDPILQKTPLALQPNRSTK